MIRWLTLQLGRWETEICYNVSHVCKDNVSSLSVTTMCTAVMSLWSMVKSAELHRNHWDEVGLLELDRSIISPLTSFLRDSRNYRTFIFVSLHYCCAAEDYFQTYQRSMEEVLEDLHFPSCVCCILWKGQEQHRSWSLYLSDCNWFTGSQYSGGQDLSVAFSLIWL